MYINNIFVWGENHIVGYSQVLYLKSEYIAFLLKRNI